MLAILPLTRRFEFPGKRRLRQRVALPESGTRDVTLGGARFRLDLAESLHRDYFFGLCDQVERRLIEKLLARGGDFVDVGAHIGLYTVSVAEHIPGRVLALEPNPSAFARLCENVALNDCGNVTAERVAASSRLGYAALHLQDGGDSSWSTLVEDRLSGTEAVDVETTTLDYEVERHGLRPTVVKIDVEGAETVVLRGAPRVLARRPALLLELVAENAAAVVSILAQLGYLVARVGTRALEPWSGVAGASNALFLQPWQLELLGRLDRRAFAHGQQQHVIGRTDPPRPQHREDDPETRLVDQLV
jgi:FkbM family methyltransferase